MNDFFANLLELWGINALDPAFSGALYDAHVFSTVGVLLVVLSVGVPAVYYKALDRVTLNQPRHWGYFWGGTVAGVLVLTWGVAYSRLQAVGYVGGGGEYVPLLFTVCVYAAGLFFVASLGLKGLSINCSKTPF